MSHCRMHSVLTQLHLAYRSQHLVCDTLFIRTIRRRAHELRNPTAICECRKKRNWKRAKNKHKH